MHRFHLPPAECQGGILNLTGGEAHHAAQVLRLRPGEAITVLDGAGHQFHCITQTVSKKAVILAVQKKEFTLPPPCPLTLLQAIPKGKTMDLIVQKATELGVAKIVPLLTERVTVQLANEQREDKRAKWQHVAVEAIKQCGQPWLPQVEAPTSLAEFFSRRESTELALVGALQGHSRPPQEVFREFRTKAKRRPQTASVWVGPEGDFTFSETEQIKASGAQPITLGRLVLRCETAAMYSLSVMNYELQRGDEE